MNAPATFQRGHVQWVIMSELQTPGDHIWYRSTVSHAIGILAEYAAPAGTMYLLDPDQTMRVTPDSTAVGVRLIRSDTNERTSTVVSILQAMRISDRLGIRLEFVDRHGNESGFHVEEEL